MRAAILTELGKDLEIRDDVELDGPGPGDVRVRLAASGVCHSDLSFQNGTIPVPVPSVIGHEGAGEVIAVGEGVDQVALGDAVILSWVPPCGRCAFCRGRQPNLCIQGFLRAVESAPFRIGRDRISGGIGTPTFAEETVVPAGAAVRVSEGIPLDVAALVGCGVMTGVGAVINTARVEPGASVVVIGCGGVGISAIQGARAAGAAEIVGVDPVESKRQWALQFGASHAVSPEGLEELRGELTEGRGFDYAIEAVGSSVTIRAAWDATRRGGTTVVVGVGRAGQKVEFDAYELFFSEKKLLGSFYGSADVRTDFARLLRMWKAGALDLEGMITQRIDLSDVNQAFRDMVDGKVIRSVIDFGVSPGSA